jgi:hypothetical protein
LSHCSHPRVIFEATRTEIVTGGPYAEIVTLPPGYRVISAFMPGDSLDEEGGSSDIVTCNGWQLIQNDEKVSDSVLFRFTMADVGEAHFQVLAERCDAADVRRSDATLTHGS